MSKTIPTNRERKVIMFFYCFNCIKIECPGWLSNCNYYIINTRSEQRTQFFKADFPTGPDSENIQRHFQSHKSAQAEFSKTKNHPSMRRGSTPKIAYRTSCDAMKRRLSASWHSRACLTPFKNHASSYTTKRKTNLKDKYLI